MTPAKITLVSPPIYSMYDPLVGIPIGISSFAVGYKLVH